MGNRIIPAGGGGSLKLITSIVLTADTASPLKFTGIPGSFNHLLVKGILRSNRAGSPSDNLIVRFNNDSTSGHYGDQLLSVVATTSTATSLNVGGTGIDSGLALVVPGATAQANTFGIFELECFNYAGSQLKSGSIKVSKQDLSAPNQQFQEGTWIWNQTPAINEIDIIANSGPNWVAGSKLYLYGLT